MGALLLFLFAEIAISTALSHAIRKRREVVLKRWIEGSLSEEELHQLKKQKWFRILWKPTSEKVSFQKKHN